MTYEDRLLHQLQDIVAATPAPAPAPRRTARVPLVAGATATAAAAAIVVAATGGTEPAFAVQDAAGDAVTVTINDIRDADGLQAKLRDAGVPADVRYVADTRHCTAPAPPGAKGEGPTLVRAYPGSDAPGPATQKAGSPPVGAPAPHGGAMRVQVRADHRATFTVDPDTFADDQRLTITASGGKLQTLAIAIGGGTDAPPPLCLP